MSLSPSPDDRGLLSGQYWAELRIFAEVARARSFNRAAARLGLSQPTIGRKVRRLQDLIGTRLFVSTKQGVHLTPRGEELAAALLVLDQSLFSIAADLKAREDDAEGIVSVAITDGLGAAFAVPAVGGFTRRHPKVRLHLKTIGDPSDLRANQVDMMLTFTPPRPRADIRCEEVGTLHMIPLASEAYLDRHGVPTRETLERHLFLQCRVFESSLPAWRGWQALCAQGRIAHYCDNTLAYGSLAAQGLGIAMLASYRARTLTPVDLGVQAALPLYAVALCERLEARSVQVAFDWLRETFDPSIPWFRRAFDLAAFERELPSLRAIEL